MFMDIWMPALANLAKQEPVQLSVADTEEPVEVEEDEEIEMELDEGDLDLIVDDWRSEAESMDWQDAFANERED